MRTVIALAACCVVVIGALTILGGRMSHDDQSKEEARTGGKQ